MRIGVEYTPAIKQSAGIGRYTRGLVGAVVASDPANQYILFSSARPTASGAFPTLPNVHPRVLPVGDRLLTIAWQRLRLPLYVDMLAGGLDVFYSPDFVLPPVRRCIKTMLQIHDLTFMVYPECADARLAAYLSQVVPRSAAAADIVLADSLSTKHDVIRLLHLPEEKVEVVYGAVDPRFERITDPLLLDATRHKFGIRRPFVLSVSTLEPRKNYIGLLDAFAQVCKEFIPRPMLVIAGRKGWLYESIFQRIEELQLQQDTLVLDYVSEPELIMLYSMADVFAFPSLYEGFGLTPLEAMACGAPVISSNASSLPEVVGQAGILVDPHDNVGLVDALKQVLSSRDLQADLRAKGCAQAKRFTWQRSAEAFLKVLKRWEKPA